MRLVPFLCLSLVAFSANPQKKEEINFKVSVEYVLYQKQITENPNLVKAFNLAAKEWEKYLPIDTQIYIDDPMINDYHNRPGVIHVVLASLNDPPYNLPFGILGLWQPTSNSILIDSELLEQEPKLAYSTILHEMGHLFGVPHIVSEQQSAYTGYIVLPEEAKPQTYVMYPYPVLGNDQSQLSQIEIDVAKQYVLNLITNSTQRLKQECIFKIQ